MFTTLTLRRARGFLLRAVFARGAGAIVGSILLGCSLLLLFSDYKWESWFSDGLSLVAGATGVALLVSAVGGRRPDWIDPTDEGGG